MTDQEVSTPTGGREARRARSPRLVVTVREEDIEFAQPRLSNHCMIAEALRAAYPRATRVQVDLQTIRFSDPAKGARYIYLTPRVAQEALVRWDQGDKPAPFSFTLRGAQITRIQSRPHRIRDEAEKPGKKEAGSTVVVAQPRKPREPKVATPHGDHKPLDVNGGTPPPLGNFARRRRFGLHSLQI